MRQWWDYAFAALVFYFTIQALITGRVSGRQRWLKTRADNPIAYWLTIVLYVAVGVGIIANARQNARAIAEEERKETAASVEQAAHAANAAQFPTGLVDRDLPPEIVAIRDSAFALHRRKLYAKAIVQYDQVIAWTRDDAQTFYWRADAHWRLGHTDLALRDFQRVVALEPTNANARTYADQLARVEARKQGR